MSTPLQRLGATLRARPSWTSDEVTGDHDIHVPSRPATVVWGHLPVERPSVATVEPGTRFRVDTVSHQGMVNGEHPTTFFTGYGITPDAVLDDVIAIYEQVERPEDASGHVLTGPIEVADAQVGDAIEVRLHGAELRVPYGVNRGAPGAGVLPDLLDAVSTRVLHLDVARGRFPFGAGLSVPAAPFPGIVAVTPPADAGFVPSRPPGRFGGNLDIKALTTGASLFLPVLRPGAGLYLGDPHSAQGDGEVNGTAIEHSSSYDLEVVVHRDSAPPFPLVRTAERVTTTGIDVDLHTALEQAVRGMIELLVGWSDGELSPAAAYALCSLAADTGIAEAVNHTAVATVSLPLGRLQR